MNWRGKKSNQPMQWCRQIDTLIYVCLFFSRLQRHSGQSLHWCLGASSSFQATFISSQSTRRNCLKAWTMTLKLQIFLLFLIKTLRYLYRLFFFVFCFLTIPCALAFSKITLQLGSCSCIKAAFFGGVDGYRSILPRAISPTSHERCALSIIILFSFVSKSLTFILIPRNKGK